MINNFPPPFQTVVALKISCFIQLTVFFRYYSISEYKQPPHFSLKHSTERVKSNLFNLFFHGGHFVLYVHS